MLLPATSRCVQGKGVLGGNVPKESAGAVGSERGGHGGMDRMREVDRLLSRLPAEERAQATQTLVQMRSALEHATKRLALDLETAEEVRQLPAPMGPEHTQHLPTHRRPTADNGTRCTGRR